MIARNKLSVINNPYQGKFPKVLCVCSGGVLRSPTASWILSQEPFKFNTRSCGDADYALIPLTEELVTWADEIVVMDYAHEANVKRLLIDSTDIDTSWPLIHVLNIEDDYDYRNPELVKLMTDKFRELFVGV